jgi:putative CocE/NonD family hydrolase
VAVEEGTDVHTADLAHGSGFAPPLDGAAIAATNRLRGRPEPPVDTFYRSRQFMFGVPDDLPFRTRLDERVLTYSTGPLAEDTEVTGHPIVHIWASSTAGHGDFFFFLEDVDEGGRAVLVTEYGHRAGFATLHDNDLMIPDNPGIDVLPDLPWHGYRRADFTDRVFADGAVVEVVTDLYPTSWVFKKGHRIRLSIAASDWPTFRLHPELAPSNNPSAPDTIVPTITVHRGADRAAYIELPVIPRGGE